MTELAQQFPSAEEFLAGVLAKKQRAKIAKWRDLPERRVYKITVIEKKETRYGLAYIGEVSRSDGWAGRVWLPKRLEEEELSLPVFVMPRGMQTSRKNSKHQYFDYHLWSPA